MTGNSWQFGLITALLVGLAFIACWLAVDAILKREPKRYDVGRDVK